MLHLRFEAKKCMHINCGLSFLECKINELFSLNLHVAQEAIISINKSMILFSSNNRIDGFFINRLCLKSSVWHKLACLKQR